jgi:hypothetical protein
MAWGGRIFQILPAEFPPVVTLFVYCLWLRVVLGFPSDFPMKAMWFGHGVGGVERFEARAWHRALGLVHHDPPCVNPLPPLLAFFFVLSWKLERSAWHALDLLLVCARFCLTGSRWPAWSTYGPDAVIVTGGNTGIGDIICNAVLACEQARYLGVRTVSIDTRGSSYLQQPEIDLFEQLIDYVPNPQAAPGDPVILPTSQLPPGARPIAHWVLFAHFGCFRGGHFSFRPRLYFDAPPSIWLDRGETKWPDDPLDESPPPCPSALWLPFNRGTDRRLLRDGHHFTNSLRLKPRFMAQFEAFKRSALDGKPTVGVHVRAGNGETGHFLVHGRGKVPIDQIHPIVEEWGRALGGEYQLLLMSDSQAYIEAYRQLKSSAACRVISRPQWKPPAGGAAGPPQHGTWRYRRLTMLTWRRGRRGRLLRLGRGEQRAAHRRGRGARAAGRRAVRGGRLHRHAVPRPLRRLPGDRALDVQHPPRQGLAARRPRRPPALQVEEGARVRHQLRRPAGDRRAPACRKRSTRGAAAEEDAGVPGPKFSVTVIIARPFSADAPYPICKLRKGPQPDAAFVRSCTVHSCAVVQAPCTNLFRDLFLRVQ